MAEIKMQDALIAARGVPILMDQEVAGYEKAQVLFASLLPELYHDSPNAE